MHALLMAMGWVGDVFLIVGLWGIGNKERNAFRASIIGEVLWIAKTWMTRPADWSLIFICCVFGFMAVRGYVLWGRK